MISWMQSTTRRSPRTSRVPFPGWMNARGLVIQIRIPEQSPPQQPNPRSSRAKRRRLFLPPTREQAPDRSPRNRSCSHSRRHLQLPRLELCFRRRSISSRRRLWTQGPPSESGPSSLPSLLPPSSPASRLVPPAGFEPAIASLGKRWVIQLPYGGIYKRSLRPLLSDRLR